MGDRVCEFGFPGPLRDRLVAAVLSGAKKATSSLLAEWEGETLPVAGEQETVIDSAGVPVAVIEITACEIMEVSAVSDAVAVAEGEDSSTAEGWRVEHERFWREEVLPQWAGGPAPELTYSTRVVVQWFRLTARLGADPD